MIISSRKWSYTYEEHTIVFKYQYSAFLKARVKLFVDDQLIDDSGWHYCRNRLTITGVYDFGGATKQIAACVDIHRSGHELKIDDIFISALKHHPIHADKHLPDKNWLWYIVSYCFPIIISFCIGSTIAKLSSETKINIYEILMQSSFVGVGVATFCYLAAKFRMWNN